MKGSTVLSVLCLAATQLVAAETVVTSTSTATNTITMTVYRVNALASESPSATSHDLAATTTGSATSSAHKTTAAGSSTSAASPLATSGSAAGMSGANMPVALAAGSFALWLGYL
ncbi:hypothetical protein ETB97_005576 [Aspergillus alliaceus]|uniref:Uncharacterized protein n=1 Tax=Petromyces alliaceus TaxID=209559 RepID=A0A5N6FVV8_PETAA|nr:uncharacterized protein BDW43DRAFT_277781 [Aspergillus alliaceus]KAB8232884.1 hypothetical protein BDW43DRAFT_277781 [Aspergillus alliaceus]KAF5865011.1 hypothetical protein ETB97_005576 [Aspergillus burnettii]